MRIKLDENIASSCAGRLRAIGHDVDTVIEEELAGHSDVDVWEAAQTEGRFLVTQDLDFSDERRYAAGNHAGLLLVRLPDSEQWRISDYLAAWLSAPEAATWERCFVVATPHKVRIRQPHRAMEPDTLP